MSNTLTLTLAAAVAVIIIVVVTMLFTSTPVRRKPIKGAAEAFHLLLSGRREEARRLLTEAIQRGEASPEAYLRLGVLLREDGDAARALALHRGLLARPTLDPELRRLTELARAEDLIALGQLEEAEARLAALDARLLDESLLGLHARALHRLGREDDAADILLQRAKLAGRPAEIDAARYLAEMGREALRAGRLETARNRARKARSLEPTLAAAYVVEGDALLQGGSIQDALRLWNDGLERAEGGRSALLPRLVEAAFHTGRMEGLVDQLEAMREAHPHDVDLWKAVADLRLRRGDLESFFSLAQDPPRPNALDLVACAGWLRHLNSTGDGSRVRRLLDLMPDAFGPRQWRCVECGATDPEPRSACARCGGWEALQPLQPDSAVTLSASDATGSRLAAPSSSSAVPARKPPQEMVP